MKKTKFLALIMTLALILTGVGYAYWTDTIVSKTVVQTGNFDMEVMATQKSPDNAHLVEIEKNTAGDKNSATFTLSNMYPGAKVQTGLRIMNKGSIPAKIESVKVIAKSVNGKEIGSLKKFIKLEAGIVPVRGTVNAWVPLFNGKLNELETNVVIPDQLKNVVIQPEDEFDFACINDAKELVRLLNVEMDKEAGDNTKDKAVEIEVQFNFTQFNAE